MTSARIMPPVAARAKVISNADRRELDRLVDDDPIVNAVIAARLNAFASIDSERFGGALLGVRTVRGDGLVGAAFNGGNLLPIGGDESSWATLAGELGTRARVCTSIVGRTDAVATMWQLLRPSWGPARAIRRQQPLLVVTHETPIPVEPDPRLRLMRPADIERYLPAAAAMFSEELDISPFAGSSGPAYRRRIENLLAGGRAFGIVDRHGQIAFKADIGALTPRTCQVQGVWVRPDLRGRGLGTAALAGVLQHGLQLAPTVSLYVNDFNTAARRLYARLGMRQVATLATVLF